MNEIMERILNEIEQKITCVQMDFYNESWRESIPSVAGWYLVKTNAPVEKLKRVGQPSEERKAHINIPKTIKYASALVDTGIAIAKGEEYVVYSGEAGNLKARAREHERGHGKTYCLGLTNYESLRSNNWRFCYVTVLSLKAVSADDKLLRKAVEQAWRAKNGWPVLCKE